MDNQTQELLTKEAEKRESLEQRVAKLEENSARLSSDSSAELADKDARIAELEAKTIDDFEPEEKAGFVVPWLGSLDGEGLDMLRKATGLTIAKIAEVKEPADDNSIPTETEDEALRAGTEYLEEHPEAVGVKITYGADEEK